MRRAAAWPRRQTLSASARMVLRRRCRRHPRLSRSRTSPASAANPETIDPIRSGPQLQARPHRQFTLTVQREINTHMQLEVGYIGKIIEQRVHGSEPGFGPLHDHPRRPGVLRRVFPGLPADVFQRRDRQPTSPRSPSSKTRWEVRIPRSVKATPVAPRLLRSNMLLSSRPPASPTCGMASARFPVGPWAARC